MNPIVIFGVCAAGAAVGLILGVIFFVTFDDSDKSRRFGHLMQLLSAFIGLGGGGSAAFGFIDIVLLPLYIGVVSLTFILVALLVLFLYWKGMI